MGLASALSTALTGLNASETTIDVVGNNVANSNTVGFKSSKAAFASQFLQTQSLGSAPSGNGGGTNPRQTGLGTKVAEITPDFTQGTIQISSNSSDLAIQGDGLFIVQGTQGETLYTRNGLFKTNSQNELVTITGQRLLGQGVDQNFQLQNTSLVPLTIPLGSAAVAQATQNVILEGTLTPTGNVATTPEILMSAVLSDGTKDVPTNLATSDITVLSPPASTTAGLVIAGPSNIAAGTYRYKIAFVDAAGNEAPPSAVVGPFTVNGTQRVQLDTFPAAPAGFTQMNVYRTDQAGTVDADNNLVYKLVDTVAAGTLTVIDDEADASLTTTLDGPLAQATYGYYITFRNIATGDESRPTALISQSVSDDGRRLLLDNIPNPSLAGPDFDQIIIYRNLSTNSSEFHQVGEINGPVFGSPIQFIDGKSDAQIVGNDTVNLDGPDINLALPLTEVVIRQGTTYSKPFALPVGALSVTLQYTGSKAGNSLATKTLTVTSATTVAEFLAFVEESTGIQRPSSGSATPIPGSPGGSIDSLGTSRLQFVANNGLGNAIDIGSDAFKLVDSTGHVTAVNLGFDSVQSAIGESAATQFLAYDSLGIPLNVRLTAVLEARDDTSTTFRWFADSIDNDPATGTAIAVGTGLIVFDSQGRVSNVTDSTVSIQRDNVSSASPLQFDLDFSRLSGLHASGSSIAATRQDGSTAGTLSSYIIGEDGLIRGVFTNGVSRDLGQIRLARFANNTGLAQRGENLFSAGVNSGLPIEGNPGDQGIGGIVAGATELSNTDIGQNLIDLITASTQYRGGTRVITAVQQLLDELLNLRR